MSSEKLYSFNHSADINLKVIKRQPVIQTYGEYSRAVHHESLKCTVRLRIASLDTRLPVSKSLLYNKASNALDIVAKLTAESLSSSVIAVSS